jgi:hypothetical protein
VDLYVLRLRLLLEGLAAHRVMVELLVLLLEERELLLEISKDVLLVRVCIPLLTPIRKSQCPTIYTLYKISIEDFEDWLPASSA